MRRNLSALSVIILVVSCLPVFAAAAPSDAELEAAYFNAVTDARIAEADEISRDLEAIVYYNTDLIWEGQPGASRVMLTTWTSWDGYNDSVGESMTVSRETWTVTPKELRNSCEQYCSLTGDSLVLRLEQLYGLPPHSGKKWFVEIWVDPDNIFRPSPDPGISDHEAELAFPKWVDAEYRNWFNDLQSRSYGENGYPWTRLGYTYDWGNPNSEIGLSEFIIRDGSIIKIHSVTDTLSYCKNRSESPAGSSRTGEEIEQDLEILMDSVIAESHVPGLVAGIWAPDEGVSFVYTAGVSDLDTKAPMDEDMIFRIGSNTKTFTITVLLQLVDEGVVNLSDPLSRYLPDYPRADEVNIEMLTNMRSGICNYSELEEFASKMETDPTASWLPKELIAMTEGQPYYFTPGTDFHYSNTNTIIVGEIIEMVTGNSLENEINKRIIDRLGLENTSYLNGGTEIPGYHPKAYYTGEYDPDFIECSEWLDCSWAGAAGSIISNLSELRTYVQALVDGYFLSDELQQDRLRGHEIQGSDKKYGMGIFSYDSFYGHNGGYPGFTSLMMHSSERNCTIIIWYNCQLEETSPTMLLPEVARIIYPDIE